MFDLDRQLIEHETYLQATSIKSAALIQTQFSQSFHYGILMFLYSFESSGNVVFKTNPICNCNTTKRGVKAKNHLYCPYFWNTLPSV